MTELYFILVTLLIVLVPLIVTRINRWMRRRG